MFFIVMTLNWILIIIKIATTKITINAALLAVALSPTWIILIALLIECIMIMPLFVAKHIKEEDIKQYKLATKQMDKVVKEVSDKIGSKKG